jgi:hypothetical protein
MSLPLCSPNARVQRRRDAIRWSEPLFRLSYLAGEPWVQLTATLEDSQRCPEDFFVAGDFRNLTIGILSTMEEVVSGRLDQSKDEFFVGLVRLWLKVLPP